MTTTKFDLAYGRQGGRILPWVGVGRVPKVGETLALTIDGITDEVTVRSVCDGGRRVDIEFKSGAQLRVPVVTLSEVPVHHRHRANDMDTAVSAAAAISTDGMTFAKIAVLKALAAAGEHGMIDHDHQPVNGLGQDTAGKRRGELVDDGLVVDSGIRRRTPRGRNAAVWVITPEGLAVLRALQARGAA